VRARDSRTLHLCLLGAPAGRSLRRVLSIVLRLLNTERTG